MRLIFFCGILLAAGCGGVPFSKGSRAGKNYAYSPPAVVKKDRPTIPTRAILFPFRDATAAESKIGKNKVTLNFIKGGYEKIPPIDGETLARNWGAFLNKSGTFKGIGYAFGPNEDRRGRIGLGGSIVQAQYLIEDPVCLLRIRVVFEGRQAGEEKTFWREELFESGKCDVDAKNAAKQHEALNSLFDALFTKALKSLAQAIESSKIVIEDEDAALSQTGEKKPAVEKSPPSKKPVASDSVVDELYRQALEAQ